MIEVLKSLVQKTFYHAEMWRLSPHQNNQNSQEYKFCFCVYFFSILHEFWMNYFSNPFRELLLKREKFDGLQSNYRYNLYKFLILLYKERFWGMSRISGLRNMNKRTFYKEQKINKRSIHFLSKQNIKHPLILDMYVIDLNGCLLFWNFVHEKFIV